MLDIHVVSHTHWDREWYLTYEQPIDERDEPEAELLVGQIPFAIPMRVRDDVDI